MKIRYNNYESFKEYVGSKNIGKELEKTQENQDIELPPEMIETSSIEVPTIIAQ